MVERQPSKLNVAGSSPVARFGDISEGLASCGAFVIGDVPLRSGCATADPTRVGSARVAFAGLMDMLQMDGAASAVARGWASCVDADAGSGYDSPVPEALLGWREERACV